MATSACLTQAAGAGLLLIGAAKREPQGSAVGVDKWVRGALTGNGTQAELRNAEEEGVAARIELVEADVRRLRFPEAAFDVAVSNFVAVFRGSSRQGLWLIFQELTRWLAIPSLQNHK